MNVYFDRIRDISGIYAQCNSNLTRWHVDHGFCYNVWQYDDTTGKIIGCFMITLIGPLGGFINFQTCEKDIPPGVILSCFRKGIKIASVLPSVWACVENYRLIPILEKFGFSVVLNGQISLDGVKYVTLKYRKK